MNRYIGIGKEVDDEWYSICLLLYSRMIKIKLYTQRNKHPTYYYYARKEFIYCIEMEITNLKWFFGFSFRRPTENH